MSASFKKLRAEIAKRAGGICEAPDCGKWIGEFGELGHADHFFGRAKAPESVETVWLLCPEHDDAKTRNSPSSTYWLGKFIRFCGRHGLPTERAEARLQFVMARAAS